MMKTNSYYVLLRFSKKTGKVDTIMTGLSFAMMSIWAMNKTSQSKETIIINKDTAMVNFHAIGKRGDIPTLDREPRHVTEYGIPVEVLAEIEDDRFI